MRIFIDGFGIVAESITKKLIENHDIRKKDLFINTYSTSENLQYLNYLDTEALNFVKKKYSDKSLYDSIKRFNPDYIFSLYAKRIFPKKILDLANKGSLNLHPSMLPEYKGCFSAPWVIINKERETGITFHEMNENIDEGDILFQKKIPLNGNETAFSLYNLLCSTFIIEFDRFFSNLKLGKIQRLKMSSGGKYYSRELPFNGIIDSDWEESQIECFIRAMFFPPKKGALVKINDNFVEVSSISEYKSLLQEKH
tara:strand:- start:2883 stop:3644 length:762 start_codon:yes stop_codon:yes gene_type:complete